MPTNHNLRIYNDSTISGINSVRLATRPLSNTLTNYYYSSFM